MFTQHSREEYAMLLRKQSIFNFCSRRCNQASPETVLLIKLTESIAKYKAAESANGRDESGSTNTEMRFLAVFSSLQNYVAFYPLPAQKNTKIFHCTKYQLTLFPCTKYQLTLFPFSCKLHLPFFISNSSN